MRRLVLVLMLIAAGLLIGAGCHDYGRFDRTPPDGKGTLYVDNNTSDELRVYIGGARQEDVRARRYRHYDLDPGVYRIVLEGRNSDRTFAGDVDVLEKRRTVMDVTTDPGNFRRYDVLIYLD